MIRLTNRLIDVEPRHARCIVHRRCDATDVFPPAWRDVARRYRDVVRGVNFLHELGNKCLASLATALKPLRAAPGQAIVQMYVHVCGVNESINE